MSCSIVSVASHSTTEPSLHMCDSAGYWNSKDKGSLQFACNKSKEEHITYGDGGLKTWSTLFVPVGSSIWDTNAAHISVIELGSQWPGGGRSSIDAWLIVMHIHSPCRRYVHTIHMLKLLVYRDHQCGISPFACITSWVEMIVYTLM